MKKKMDRKTLVIRFGFTPKHRWKKYAHYYLDAFRFFNWPSATAEENGVGIRVLWFIVSFAILVD